MKALLISDIHGDQKFLQNLPKIVKYYDIILCAGDLTDFGRPEGYAYKLDDLLKDKTCFWVSGNNDMGQDYQYRLKNMQNIDGKIVECQGHKFAGLGGSYQNYESQNFGPSLIGQDTDLSDCIFISHIPPSIRLQYSSMDLSCHSERSEESQNQNTRSFDKLRMTPRNAPLAHICGHIHSAAGVACLGLTKVIKLAPAKFGAYAELDPDTLKVVFKKLPYTMI